MHEARLTDRRQRSSTFSLKRPGRIWIYGVLVAITCVANSLATEPALKPTASTKKAAQKRFVRKTSDQLSGWTRPKNLPNSSDTLKWQRPDQVRMAEIHRPRPSYLRSPVKAAPVRAAEQLNARLDIPKSSVQIDLPEPKPTPTTNVGLLVEFEIPPRPISVQQAATAATVPNFREDTLVRFVSGQNSDDTSGVFDDVLDEILQEEDAEIKRAQRPEKSEQTETPTLATPPTKDELALPNELPNPDVDSELPNLANDLPTTDTDKALTPEPRPEPNSPKTTTQSDLNLPELDDSNQPSQELPVPDNTFIPQFDSTLQDDNEFSLQTPTNQLLDQYNGRNCPSEEQLFQKAWDEMRHTPISSISLDITPQIQPTESIQQNNRILEQNMSRAPSREWRDRNGRLLAKGRMVNYNDGRVDVETTTGAIESISWYALSNIDLCFVSAWWDLPSEFSAATNQYEPRNWTMSTFTWTASALCHKPLYFQEVQLERYGHSAGPMKQAALSGAHFFGNILFLPYHMGVTPPTECKYSLGYYRPGSCAPWLLPAVPLSARGARWQLAALVGGLVIFP